jgi:hypothetical protein
MFVSATCAGCGRQITVVPLSRVALCGSCVTRAVDPALAAKLTVETREPLLGDARTPVPAPLADAPALEPAETTSYLEEVFEGRTGRDSAASTQRAA